MDYEEDVLGGKTWALSQIKPCLKILRWYGLGYSDEKVGVSLPPNSTYILLLDIKFKSFSNLLNFLRKLMLVDLLFLK